MIKPRVAKKGESFWDRLPDVIQREADGILYIIFLPGRFTLNGIMRGQVDKCTMYRLSTRPLAWTFQTKKKAIAQEKQKSFRCMCIFVCICMFVCGCVCVGMYTCMPEGIYVWLCIWMHVCMYLHVHAYMCVYVCVYVCVVICLSGLCFPNFSM